MRKETIERIKNIARLYKKIVLFHKEESHFSSVFRAVLEKYDSDIIDDFGGVQDSEHCAVIICSNNEIYAEEFQRVLIESGHHSVFIPKDFGLTYSANKLDGIEFNLNIGCSLNCYYCPQGVLLSGYEKYGKNSKKRHLIFEDFKFIVDERMNPGASVGFSGMSEPFENEDFLRMLLYASENGNTILLNTTLMGLSNKMLDWMLEKKIKIDECILHIPDNKGNSHFRVTEEYVAVLEKYIEYYGSCIIYITCHGSAPHESVMDIVKNSGIKDIRYEDKMGARCGNLDESVRKRPLKKKGRLICTLGKSPCLSPVCMPDGTLGLCCNDYALNTEIGNILDDEWYSIVSAAGVQSYLQAADDEDMEYICRYCGNAQKRDIAIQQVYPDYLCYGENYYRVKALFARGKHEIVKKIFGADHVCIFGLGKFFKDNYFQAGWSEIIGADLLSDNNEKMWGKNLGGIPIVSKMQLQVVPNLLVIVYTMSPNEIIEDLRSMGIFNILKISDIMEAWEDNRNV